MNTRITKRWLYIWMVSDFDLIFKKIVLYTWRFNWIVLSLSLTTNNKSNSSTCQLRSRARKRRVFTTDNQQDNAETPLISSLNVPATRSHSGGDDPTGSAFPFRPTQNTPLQGESRSSRFISWQLSSAVLGLVRVVSRYLLLSKNHWFDLLCCVLNRLHNGSHCHSSRRLTPVWKDYLVGFYVLFHVLKSVILLGQFEEFRVDVSGNNDRWVSSNFDFWKIVFIDSTPSFTSRVIP